MKKFESVNESMVISGKKYNFNSNGRCLNP